ncbi:ABC transporter ATP-binding protein [bacterium]|nr:ABC transporter ATP-binding protein [bacterium]
MPSPVVTIHNLSKRFSISSTSYSLVLDMIKSIFFKQPSVDHVVLDNISFEVNKGETFAIIGKNGSGKSTLLKIITGVTQANSGTVETKGKIISLLEVGAGFSPLLSGRENIYLNAALNGLTRTQTETIIEDIISYSGIEDSIDQALYQYSSGMAVRLGFAIAVHCHPEILVIDEALAVGDITFQAQCIDTIVKLKEQGCTILFVSHDLSLVSGLCDRAILINDSQILANGPASSVVAHYIQLCGDDRSNYAITMDNLKLYFNAGNVSIIHHNAILTKVFGIYTSIYAYKTWHDSDQCLWELHQQTHNQMVLKGKMRRLPIKQTWTITVIDENTFNVKVELDFEKNCRWSEIQLSCMLSPDFTNWLVGQETGTFAQKQESWDNWLLLSSLEHGTSNTVSAIHKETQQSITIHKKDGLPTQASALITSKELNSSVLQFLHFNQETDKCNQTLLFFDGSIKIHPHEH